MIPERKEFYLAKFEKEINSRIKDLDPDTNEAWGSLIFGWAVGVGMNKNEAREFTIAVPFKRRKDKTIARIDYNNNKYLTVPSSTPINITGSGGTQTSSASVTFVT